MEQNIAETICPTFPFNFPAGFPIHPTLYAFRATLLALLELGWLFLFKENLHMQINILEVILRDMYYGYYCHSQ